MAGRIRTLKPELLDDEKVAALAHLEFRLFVSAILLADDQGNLRGDAGYVAGTALWQAPNSSRDSVEDALETLARVSLLGFYEVRGQLYLHVMGWTKHQKVDKPSKPRMPTHDDVAASWIDWDKAVSRTSRERLESHARESSRDTRESPRSGPPTSDLRSRPPTASSDPPRAHAIPGDVVGAGAVPSTPPNVVPIAVAYDPQAIGARGKLARQIYQRVSDARLEIGKARGHDVLPLPDPNNPSSRPRAFRDLCERVDESGADAPRICNLVVDSLILDARKNGLEWLGEKSFTEGAWRTARERVGRASDVKPSGDRVYRMPEPVDDRPDLSVYDNTEKLAKLEAVRKRAEVARAAENERIAREGESS